MFAFLADTVTLIAALSAMNPTALLYLAAAIVARRWHERVWLVYLAMALAAPLGPHH